MNREQSFDSLAWQIVVLVLSVLTLVFLAKNTRFDLKAETSSLFFLLDTILCRVDLADVAYQAVIHPNRRRYWRGAG